MNKMIKEILGEPNHLIKQLAILTLVVFCYFYSIWGADFAERHITVSFLEFPIFIGEIFLILMTIFYIIERARDGWHLTRKDLLIGLFFLFVLVKAFYGYPKWGALAFRNAAIFYYSVFTVYGAYFFKKKMFSFPLIITTIFFLLLGFATRGFLKEFLMTAVLLSVILIRACPSHYKFLKVSLFIILAIVLPHDLFFFASRTCLIANTVVSIFLVVILSLMSSHFKWHQKGLFIFIFFIILAGFIGRYADPNAIKSLTHFQPIFELYRDNKDMVEAVGKGYEPMVLSRIRLFNPQDEAALEQEKAKAYELSRRMELVSLGQTAEEKKEVIEGEARGIGATEKVSREELKRRVHEYKKREGRNLGTHYTNIVFRLLIWEDMVKDILRERLFFGFDFGKPFRSKSLEITMWGYNEWSVDGWISAHNSYLQIIYNAGLIGIGGILFVLYTLYSFTRRSICARSINGLLLCGILINWLTASFSSVVLELPYYAIPFWSLMGVTYAYMNQMKEQYP